MTAIIVYARELVDVRSPVRALYIEVGRATHERGGEFLCLGNRSKRVLLDMGQAANFLRALRRLNLAVSRGELDDKDFYSFDIQGLNGTVLGVDLGIAAGCPYIGVEDIRVNVPAEDLSYFAAACMSMQHLAGGIGVASRIAQAPPGPRPWWHGYGRSLDPTPLESAWYEADD